MSYKTKEIKKRLLEEFWDSEENVMSDIILNTRSTDGKSYKPIGELTDEEIMEEFKICLDEDLTDTKNFIITWLKITGRAENIREEFPEYFL